LKELSDEREEIKKRMKRRPPRVPEYTNSSHL